MRNDNYRLLIGIALWLPLTAFAQPSNTTFTTSTSAGVGPTNAEFVWVTNAIGPAIIAIGDFGACAIPPGPYPNANCTLFGGSGSVPDPFVFQCASPLPLSGCTLPGTPFVVVVGTSNLDGHLHVQTALAAQASVAVPLDSWVPLGSAIAIMLLALAWWRRPAGLAGADRR